ncbi:MFS transporter [Nocardiopsis alba]|uniref:MFS transporter n=1 Tax=Nocardiopsis alba TaxID=53437 RepID=UPI00034A8170|nr:MFS transporter [Nocardiopsis alba]
MPNPYARIFSAPGAKAFTAAGLIGRMPVAMTNIGLITMLSATYGGYGLAGAVAATFTLSMALISPRISRLADRFGQRRVLPPAALVSVASLLAMSACVWLEAPTALLFVLAIPAGAMPNMSAMSRARWTEIHRGTPRLRTAYAFESVADELTFITGPALSVVLSTMAFAQAGPLAAAAFLAVGVGLFVAQRSTEPPVRVTGPRATERGRRLLDTHLLLLVAILLAGGVIVGAIDVVAVAFAEARGVPGATGIVLSCYALGSAVSGLVFGGLRIPWRPRTQLTVAVTGTALTAPLLLTADGIVTLSLVVLVSGVFFAPMMILVMTLIEGIVAPERLTEGMTWALTGLTVGTALGTFAAGRAVEAGGTDGGLHVAIVAGAAALVVVLVANRLPERVAKGGEEVNDSATLGSRTEEER